MSLEEVDMKDLNDVLNKKKTNVKLAKSKSTIKRSSGSWEVEEVTKKVPQTIKRQEMKEEKAEIMPTFDKESMKEWETLNIPTELLASLHSQCFVKPTMIQMSTIAMLQSVPSSDILGTAPTGSGKTLAFGIPICKQLMERESFFSLILVPTRELALQIRDHLQTLLKYTKFQRTIQAVVGGMAKEKQERLLLHAPKVLIATPGRLQELINEDIAYGDTTLTSALKRMDIFVLDEADRLLESGHFKDLDKILSIVKQKQTFLFSATLASGEDRKTQEAKLKKLESRLALHM